ncbi:acyltransferase [Phenylobacterium sp.]|jgi:peptidoglycan/LPS O-acetylase OafA/YrhL|uniref:acyltransferase family protein n=1 Tax=Phenylobacterium sp. TaxID=1871053 RepID=UPI002F94049E
MQQVHPRGGGFDSIRLVAALMVFHGHMYALAGRPQPLLPGGTFGSVAVIVFFVVSGYWVTRSALERTLVSYAAARALRIVPGLAVCCAVTILGCALASSIPVNDYLRSPTTWGFMWNSFPFFHTAVPAIPGVFQDGPVADAVNGSLWTLRYEVFCYLVVAAAAVFGLAGVRAFIAAAAVFGLAVLSQAFGAGLDAVNARYIVLTDFLQLGWAATFLGAFAFGAWLHGADARRPVQIASVSAVAMALGWHDPIVAQAASIFLYGALAVWIGRGLDLDRRLTRGQDISYGLYIYAFPVQQLAVRWLEPHRDGDFAATYLVALGVTVLLAALSWICVERPALRLKARVARGGERLVASVNGRLRRRRSVGDGDLAEQAGRARVEVDAVDPHPVLGRGAGH